jgi:ATP-binding cassette subfamily B protein
MKENLDAWTWRLDDAAVALEAIGRRLGIDSHSEEVARFSPDRERHDLGFGNFVEAIAPGLGLEIESVAGSYADANDLLDRCGPALLRVAVDEGDPPRFAVVLGSKRRHIRVLGPDLRIHRIDRAELRARWADPLVRAVGKRVDALLDRAKVSADRRSEARTRLIAHRFGTVALGGCWLVRPAAGGSLRPLLREAGAFRNLAGMLTAHAGQYALLLASWVLLGSAALDGRVELSLLGGWLLLLVSMIPLQLAVRWFQGRLSVGLGAVIKNRLLRGVLRLDPETIRDEGSGHLLGRVLESEAVGSLALGAGLLAVVSIIELVMSMVVLGLGAGGILHAGLLALWVAFAAAWSYRYYRTRRRTTAARMELTHDLVERIVGHRTRLAQQRPDRWHDGEDQAMSRYLELCRSLDRLGIILGAIIARGWMIVGLAGLLPAVGSDATTASFAVGLGGVLMAEQALTTLTSGLSSLASAAISWEQASPLFAAARETPRETPAAKLRGEPPQSEPILDAQNLAFRYPGRGQAILRECSLRIFPGDRVLLEGPSGGGKSTLASLLAGLREPDHGLLFARGLDPASLGPEGWRKVVATAPQFHENHVLTGTFAFNLLMGSNWPPDPGDFQRAETICRELELGPLLDRMPSGMQQMVGESGWQLSHGEKSRLYIARALLQDADLIVLDESFAALDPQTLQKALRCVLERAPTLLVIAHP